VRERHGPAHEHLRPAEEEDEPSREGEDGERVEPLVDEILKSPAVVPSDAIESVHRAPPKDRIPQLC
jgi:hypothetical protein